MDAGTPRGAVISPLLSNLYLNPLDGQMSQAGFERAPDADDFVVLCRSRGEADRALETVRGWCEANGLQLHPEKTRVVEAAQPGGFDFLGYHFERYREGRGMKWASRKSERKLRENIKPRTKRNNGHSLSTIIADLNPVLRGWFEYSKHAKENTFVSLDGWVRGRLRGILRKRRKGKGRARGSDHQRWPNAYFAEAGLFSMLEAQRRLRQPALR